MQEWAQPASITPAKQFSASLSPFVQGRRFDTLGNLSHLLGSLIDIIRRSLQDETFVPLAQAFEISR